MLFKNPAFSIELFIFYLWPNIPVVLAKKQNNSRRPSNPLWFFLLWGWQNHICHQVLIFSFRVCLGVHMFSNLDQFLNFDSHLLGDLFTFSFCSLQSICLLTVNDISDMHVSSTIICILTLFTFLELRNPFCVVFNLINLIYTPRTLQ